jgi:hypothetical protein
MEMEETRDPNRGGKVEDNQDNEQPMVCPFCGWEATDGEYVMLLVRSLRFGVPLATQSSLFVSSSCLSL